MDITLYHPIFGSPLNAPSSKSHLQRLLLCAGLADSPSRIAFDGTLSDDIAAMLDGVNALGAKTAVTNGEITVCPRAKNENAPAFHCRESGAVLRFFMALCAGADIRITLRYSDSLAARPMQPLLDTLRRNGAVLQCGENELTILRGTDTCDFTVPGDISSQFISGLLFACIFRGGTVKLLTPLQSASYVGMTVGVLNDFGCPITEKDGIFTVPACFPLHSRGQYSAEGDWSASAYALIGGLTGRTPVTVNRLSPDSLQGDAALLPILKSMGANITAANGSVTAAPSMLHAVTADGGDIPDLLLPLCAAACAAKGETVITNAGRLAYKETDRLRSVTGLITALGGNIRCDGETLRVIGSPLYGGKVNGCGDHRTVMTAALAATFCEKEVTITDAESVNKSFPAFFSQFRSLRS